jgi:hypothetical protein
MGKQTLTRCGLAKRGEEREGERERERERERDKGGRLLMMVNGQTG